MNVGSKKSSTAPRSRALDAALGGTFGVLASVMTDFSIVVGSLNPAGQIQIDPASKVFMVAAPVFVVTLGAWCGWKGWLDT